ncbi:DUF2357 domain-containing protein [Salinimicrobium sp. 3283s]|uniref:DUF2357 domain-containing protein n=1 Tax=Salinimicrobium sp. 3283s TaxID=3114359 RepID=UPI0031E4FE70
MVKDGSITIELNSIREGLCLFIDERRTGSLYELEDAAEHNEARFQLVEGCFYDYTFSEKEFYFLKDNQQIVQPHSRNKHTGTLSPNIYVGTLSLPFYHESKEVGTIELEIQSIKAGYRDDYRDMLELITEKCTDLLMQANAPVSHHFETDYTKDSQTLYQKFAFISSIIGTDEFAESVHRIASAPVTTWKETNESRDVRQARRFSNANLREIIKGSNRTALPQNHHLRSYSLDSLPGKISFLRKTDSVDTPENRFIKHALQVFLKFCTDIKKASNPGTKLFKESDNLIKELESYLHHNIFHEISRPVSLGINSPVLQRKEGYREILRVWLMFDLAAKLIWTGGDDIYKGGKKDIAVLYEYWLFFSLLDLFQTIFDIEPKEVSELIKETEDGLNLQIKQGKRTALSGVYNTGSRKMNIRFCYNRSFSGKKEYPRSGSWTTTMRPDYTLSFWPQGIIEAEAEKQELIVHVHFDAKYKIANLAELLKEEDQEDELDEEKTRNRKGIYKNADLIKMHAYKDAIRRTGGAYVLYPGETSVVASGFHEIIPGLGAFPVRPSKSNSGIGDLKAFILEVIEHFINRASQREKMAYKVYEIHKKKPNELKEALPETVGENRNLIPDDTHVLVAFYKKQNWDWIIKSGLYNARANNNRGSLRLGLGEAGAKYLLLHSEKETVTNQLFKIIETGPRVFSKQTLIDKGYPSTPSQEYYLVYKVKQVKEKEFLNQSWDIAKLEGYRQGRGSALPFSVTLTELMNAVNQ